MTSTARSAMRLASSWMVIASGIVTSRTSFSLGSSLCSRGAALRAAAERRVRALAHLVGAQRGDERQAAARPFGRGLGRAGRALRRRRRPHRAAGTAAHHARGFVFFGFELRDARPALARRCGLAFAEALLGDLVGLASWFRRRACGARLRRACAPRRRRARPSRWPRAARGSCASSSAILRSSASRRRASPSAWARRLCSSSVSVRSTTPEAFGAGAAGAQPGAGVAGLAAARPALRVGAAAARSRRAASGLPSAPGMRRFLTSDDHLLAAAMAEALPHHAGLGARLERQRRLSDAQRSCRQGSCRLRHSRSESCQFRVAAGAASARPAGRRKRCRRAIAPETCHSQARQAGLHVPHLTGPMPNPIGPRECVDDGISLARFPPAAARRRACDAVGAAVRRMQQRHDLSRGERRLGLAKPATTTPGLAGDRQRIERGALPAGARPVAGPAGR